MARSLRRVAVLASVFAVLAAQPAAATVIFIPIITVVPPPQVPSAKTGGYDKIHNVAVLTAIGTKVNVSVWNFWFRRNAAFETTDLGADEAVNATMQKYLGSRFTIKDIAYDRKALAAIPNGRLALFTVGLRQYLEKIPHEDIDAFIVVRPDLEDGMQGSEGISVQVDQSNAAVWANYEIDVVDAHTYEVIGKSCARVLTRQGAEPGFAAMYGDANLAVGQPQDFGPAQHASVRKVLSMLIPLSVTETLRSLDLGLSLPPVGDRSIAPPIDIKDPYDDIKSVAVFSAIGGQVEFQHLGATIFAHSSDHLPVDWNIDAREEARLRTALAKRFTVKDVPLDHGKLAASRLFDDDMKFEPEFPGLEKSDTVDAYVGLVRVPAMLGMMLGKGQGIGMWNHSWLFGNETGVFAHYALVVIDAHTLKLRYAQKAVMSTKNAAPDPYRDVEKALWTDKPDTWPAESNARVRNIIEELLDDSLPETLYRMRLYGDQMGSQP